MERATNGNFIRDFSPSSWNRAGPDGFGACLSVGWRNANQTDPEVVRRLRLPGVLRDAILRFPFPSSAAAAVAASGYLSIYTPPFSPIFRRGGDTNEEERRKRCQAGSIATRDRDVKGGRLTNGQKTFFVFSSLASRGC